MTTAMATDNPFRDPATSSDELGRDNSVTMDSTLAVGRDASLSLGTDSLVVLGELQVQYQARPIANGWVRRGI
jgi:sphingosine kinase